MVSFQDYQRKGNDGGQMVDVSDSEAEGGYQGLPTVMREGAAPDPVRQRLQSGLPLWMSSSVAS